MSGNSSSGKFQSNCIKFETSGSPSWFWYKGPNIAGRTGEWSESDESGIVILKINYSTKKSKEFILYAYIVQSDVSWIKQWRLDKC